MHRPVGHDDRAVAGQSSTAASSDSTVGGAEVVYAGTARAAATVAAAVAPGGRRVFASEGPAARVARERSDEPAGPAT
jgi:hypothetical protein